MCRTVLICTGWSSLHFPFPVSWLFLLCLPPFFLWVLIFFFPLPALFLPPHNPAFRLPLAICIFLHSQMWHSPWKSCMFCFALSAGSKEEFTQILLTEAPALHDHQDLSKFHFAASTQSKKLHQEKTTKAVSSKRIFWTRISSFIWCTLHNIKRNNIAAGLFNSWFFLFFISNVEDTVLTLPHVILLAWNNSVYKTKALKPFPLWSFCDTR